MTENRPLNVDTDPNNCNVIDTSPISIINVDKKANNSSSEHFSLDDSIGFESDVDDYDSDCSLGSMNFLYLSLTNKSKRQHFNKTNTIIKKQFSDETNDLIQINKTPLRNNNLATEIKYAKKIMISDHTKDERRKKKMDTSMFYGKQKLQSIQCHYPKLSDLRKLKRKRLNSKTLQHKFSVKKFRQNVNQFHTSFKKPKHRKHLFTQRMLTSKNIFLKNEKLIRNQLKECVPLLQFNHKALKVEQNCNKYPLLKINDNWLLNKIEFILDFEIVDNKKDIIQYNYVENQLSEVNTGLIIDFIDIDDFGCTQMVNDIISKLFDEDNITNE